MFLKYQAQLNPFYEITAFNPKPKLDRSGLTKNTKF